MEVEPLIPTKPTAAKMVLYGRKKEISRTQFWNLIDKFEWLDLSDGGGDVDRCWKNIQSLVTIEGFHAHFRPIHNHLKDDLGKYVTAENLDVVAAHILLHGRHYVENCMENPDMFSYLEHTNDFDPAAADFIPNQE